MARKTITENVMDHYIVKYRLADEKNNPITDFKQDAKFTFVAYPGEDAGKHFFVLSLSEVQAAALHELYAGNGAEVDIGRHIIALAYEHARNSDKTSPHYTELAVAQITPPDPDNLVNFTLEPVDLLCKDTFARLDVTKMNDIAAMPRPGAPVESAKAVFATFPPFSEFWS